MSEVRTQLTPAGNLVYLTGLERLAGASELLGRLHLPPAALLTDEVHAALTAQDAGAVLLHLDVLEPPHEQRRTDAAGQLGGFLLSVPLGLKLYDSEGGRWLLDVNLVFTVSDYAGGDDFALQTDFAVNSAVQLED